MVYMFGRFLCWLGFAIYAPIKISGRSNIPNKGGFIIAGNHISYLDPLVLGVAVFRPLNYMARDTLFRNRVFAWILRHVNVFPLKRNSADFGAIKEALKRLKKGEGLVLFPEGTRSADGTITEGLEGVGFLARKSGVPVIPAFIDGTQKAMPKGSKGIRPARLKVVFGRPLFFSADDGLTDTDRTKRIMKQIILLKEASGSLFVDKSANI